MASPAFSFGGKLLAVRLGVNHSTASLKELEQIYRVNENALKVRLFRARQRVLKAYNAASAEGKL